MTKLKEYQLDPNTGAFIGDTPGMDDYESMGGTESELGYDETNAAEVEQELTPASDMAVAVADIPAQAPPIVWVSLRDIATVHDREDEVAFEITLVVEVRCPQSQNLIETGIVTRRVRISKQSLATELVVRGNATPITEAVVEEIKQQKLDEVAKLAEEKRQAAIKRARELAGLPGKGTWV